MTSAIGAGSQSPGSGLWGQIQLQQAQRNADQAEQQARALQSQARQAQSAADRAQEAARSLQVDSSQARTNADSARRGVVALSSLNEVQAGIGELREQIAQVLTTPTPVQEAPAPVVNTSGQQTGTLVNVTA
jgi:chromosome segregation ATPase